MVNKTKYLHTNTNSMKLINKLIVKIKKLQKIRKQKTNQLLSNITRFKETFKHLNITKNDLEKLC